MLCRLVALDGASRRPHIGSMADTPDQDSEAVRHRRIAEAAQRALAEAEARRRTADRSAPLPAETGGPKGPEPTRHGDWEKDGIASDF
jgi:hypothetical protein